MLCGFASALTPAAPSEHPLNTPNTELLTQDWLPSHHRKSCGTPLSRLPFITWHYNPAELQSSLSCEPWKTQLGVTHLGIPSI